MNEEQEPANNRSTRLTPPNAAIDRLCELNPANIVKVALSAIKVLIALQPSYRRLFPELTYVGGYCASTDPK
jgi:hypothetical protein